MHGGNNIQRHVWLLSGTGEGPRIVEAFLANGWGVSVSVVSDQASLIYLGLPLENLWVGALSGPKEIKGILSHRLAINKPFDLVVDATHPFAVNITFDLKLACNEINQKLVRFERPLSSPGWVNYISKVDDLAKFSFRSKKVLFAIGSRSLSNGVHSIKKSNGLAFARILPSPESLKEALAANIPNNHLAVLKPFQGNKLGEYEEAICRFWSITTLVCRQSGGTTQHLWEQICKRNNLELWMIKRPSNLKGIKIVSSIENIFQGF